MYLNCKEVNRLVSHRLDRELSLLERAKVGMHLAICFLCRRFVRQIDTMRRLTESAGAGDSVKLLADGVLVQESLSPDAKARLQALLAGQNPPDAV